MKQVLIRTEKILAAYNILAAAKYSKLEDADKLKLFKIARVLKPIAEQFDSDQKSLAEKFKPEGFDGKINAWNETREKTMLGIKDGLPMTSEEFVDFNYKVIGPYNKSVKNASKEFAEKEVELEFEPISENAFLKLMNSNDWEFGKVAEISELIVE